MIHPKIDFYLPHEFGGLGEPIEPRYQQVNIFPETRDLPVIKPRTTVNSKNEFNVKIEKIEDFQGYADMSLFKKTVKELEEKEILSKLREDVKAKKEELAAEMAKLAEIKK